MGYRGSKSEIYNTQSSIINSVKEQRVDGSCKEFSYKKFINNSLLRCTLMGFERSYQINNLSKQFKINFSTIINNTNLNPY